MSTKLTGYVWDACAASGVAVHKKRERDPKKMRHHVVSHFT